MEQEQFTICDCCYQQISGEANTVHISQIIQNEQTEPDHDLPTTDLREVVDL